ncbi:hypothetical protein CPC08DRAFT_559429 [Agrocybe pediades]|nr:hypothetical protein CPC08DRAFT_559429 [Agrocybe pediades]
MRAAPFVSLLSALVLLPIVLGIPVNSRPGTPSSRPETPEPTAYPIGEYVGVRPGAYEEKHPSHKKTSIHPGIKPPFNPPQAPIEHFQTGTGIYGNVVLAPRPISPSDMKTWKSKETGEKQTPLDKHGYKKLIKALEPHKDWKPPKDQPRNPAHAHPQRPAQRTAHSQAGSSTGPGTAQHAQNHRSGPHRPAPAGSHSPGRTPHAQPHPQSGSSNRHGSSHSNVHPHGTSSHQGTSRIRRPSSPGSHAHPANRAPTHPGAGHQRGPSGSGHPTNSRGPAHGSSHTNHQQGPGGSSGTRRPSSPGSHQTHSNKGKGKAKQT